MRRLFSILMLSASLFSCSELADYPMEVVLETKVMLDGGSTIWNQGAEVSVFYKSDSNEKWIYDSTSCALVGTRSKLKEEKNDSIVAVYPYCPAAELDRNLIYTELPASQPYVDGDSGACIMWAATQNDELHFRHATSIVALKITGQADIDSLVFSSSGGETVAGKVCLDMSENSPAVKPYEDGTASEIVIRSKDGSVIEVDGGLTVYVSVIPQVFSRGFKFSAMMSDGSVQDVQVSQETVLEPGKIRIMEMAVEDKFVLDLKFSDGQNRMNPFLMSLWPTTDMVTGELIGPYHLIDYPFDYPFCL